MSIQRKLIYMAIGGLLALSLFVGAYVTFAQSGDGSNTQDDATTETEPEAGTAENGADDSSSTESVTPFGREFRNGPGEGFRGTDDSQLLADALGITIDELNAAYQTAAEAAIQQAVDEGLITQDQADALSSGEFGFHRGFELRSGTIDFDALLADALGISVDDLQAARNEVQAARLAEMVDAGVITQEQADLMLARKAVQDYIDTNAISDALQSAYESAVNDALAAGAITQEQADLMMENMPAFDGMGFGFGMGDHDFDGHGGPGFGGRGFHGQGGPGAFFAPPTTNSQSSAETSGA